MPDTLSWADVLPVEGPNGDLNTNNLNYQPGPEYGLLVVEPIDDGYYNGINAAWADLESLFLDILAPVDLDLSPSEQEDLDDFLDDRRKVKMLEWGGGVPLWYLGTEDFSLNDFWWELLDQVYDYEEDRLQQVARNLARGDFYVPVTVEDWSGNYTTTSVHVEIVDMQIPLTPGWNARSTPIELDGGGWSGGSWIDDPARVDAVLKYDPYVGWVLMTSTDVTALVPLEGVYIHMKGEEQMGLTWGKSSAPLRDLGPSWNLVGLGAYDYYADILDAFASIEQAPGDLTGWTSAASIGQDFNYDEDWIYNKWDLDDSTDWWLEQSAWTDYPDQASESLYTGFAYWVDMEHEDEFTGSSLPPVSFDVDWIQ